MKLKAPKLKNYICQYKDNETNELKTWNFQACNKFEAQLIAERFCDEFWHKLYGVLEVSK